MAELTSLKAVTLLAKLYTGYAYSLAFIFQSSLVLILAVLATVLYLQLLRRATPWPRKPNRLVEAQPLVNRPAPLQNSIAQRAELQHWHSPRSEASPLADGFGTFTKLNRSED